MSNNQAWNDASRVIGKTIATTLKGVEREVSSRTYRASNELRNASLHVLRGTRTGRKYRIPGTRQIYRASNYKNNESPANRTGIFRNSWGTHVSVAKRGKSFRAVASIESRLKVGRHLLGDILEYGTVHMKPRPYKQKIIDMAMPRIRQIYSKSYMK